MLDRCHRGYRDIGILGKGLGVVRLLKLDGSPQDFGASGAMALRSRDALCLTVVTAAHDQGI